MSEALAPVFLRESTPITAADFVAAAIDPAASVVINACAGSGKTTLLVRRIVRCLLAGTEPSAILAITFTRAAAQEMEERVQRYLRQLAFADEADALRLLRDELMLGEAAPASLPQARGLYERVLTDPRGIELTTFHRWFWQLARIGNPAASDEPVDALVENAVEVISAAWLRWLDGLRGHGRAPIAAAFDRSVANLGADATRRLLRSFLEQRVEWLVAVADATQPLPRLDDEAALLAGVVTGHQQQWRQWAGLLRQRLPAGSSLDDDALVQSGVAGLILTSDLAARLQAMAALLGQGGKKAAGIGDAIVMALAGLQAVLARAGAPGVAQTGADPDPGPVDGDVDVDIALLRALRSLAEAMLTRQSKPLNPGFGVKAFAAAVSAAGGEAAVNARWEDCCNELLALIALQVDAAEALPLNRDLLMCGASLTATYQALKRERGEIDFVDLEAIAGRMLRDEAWAALLQVRLDRRYRQLMFDEFQDTSSLQWTVISQWLMAYAGAGSGEPPSIFVVGDPKQAIYRFRRAESRVFDAATELLQDAFGATRLTTATTHRNAPPIMAALNAALTDRMPGFLAQATRAAEGPALVWRLPRPLPADRDPGERGDWLIDLRGDRDDRFRDEGLAIGRALLAAREQLGLAGLRVDWSQVIVLAKGRRGFAEYERALRSLGIPVVSDRRGGLLDSLEAGDLVALLRFAHAADDNLALARVLRSPLIGFSAHRLGGLAAGRAAGETLWQRLVGVATEGDLAAEAARTRLEGWVAAARQWPIHDVLDRIIGDIDAEMAYARCVDPAQQAIVVGNLRALVGLALDHDGGRYPGIDRFLHHVGALGRLDDKDAPDEGRPVEQDAVRLMTIHGSKGLEADLVVMADVGGVGRRDGARFTIDWPPDQVRPRSVGFRLDKSRLGALGLQTDEAEAALDAVEDWNLLYVAATRARRGLIISARAPGRQAGAAADDWYQRLAGVPEVDPASLWGCAPGGASAMAPAAGLADAPLAPDGAAGAARGGFRGVVLTPLGVGQRAIAAARASAPAGQGDLFESPEMDEAADAALAMLAGTGLHAVLQWQGQGLDSAAIADGLEQLGLPAALATRAVGLAEGVRRLPALAGAFGATGRDEFELFDAAGRLLRIDRIVRVGDALWIIDYKWSIGAGLRPSYVAQLQGYRAAVAALPELPAWATDAGPIATIRTVLVDAMAGRAEFDPR